MRLQWIAIYSLQVLERSNALRFVLLTFNPHQLSQTHSNLLTFMLSRVVSAPATWNHLPNNMRLAGSASRRFVALGVLFAVKSFRTPHQQLDPRFILVVIVIGVIWFAAGKQR
jgi:hypothetical protein